MNISNLTKSLELCHHEGDADVFIVCWSNIEPRVVVVPMWECTTTPEDLIIDAAKEAAIFAEVIGGGRVDSAIIDLRAETSQ